MQSKSSKNDNLIQNYFKKIKCELNTINNSFPDNCLKYLQYIFTCHIQTYPFHNFELRAASHLHPVYRKSLTLFNMNEFNHGINGGFCFQSSLVLFKALQSVGFDVYCSIAKVLNGLSPDSLEAKKIPATHLVLIVNINNKNYLLDPSMGMHGHSAPFLLSESESIYDQNSYKFKIEKINNEYLLYRECQGKWNITFCSSLLPADQKTISTQLTKLGCYPVTLGIRDIITLVGIATPEGGKSLLWNPKTSNFTLKVLYSRNDIKEENFDDMHHAWNIVCNEFNIEHISRLQFKEYCNEKNWPQTRRSHDVNFPLDENEIKKFRSNF